MSTSVLEDRQQGNARFISLGDFNKFVLNGFNSLVGGEFDFVGVTVVVDWYDRCAKGREGHTTNGTVF